MEADYKVYPINVFKEAFEKTNSEIKFDDAFPNIVLSNGRLNMVCLTKMHNIIKKLPQRYRKIIELRFAEGMPFREMSEEFNICYSAIYSKYRMVLKTIVKRSVETIVPKQYAKFDNSVDDNMSFEDFVKSANLPMRIYNAIGIEYTRFTNLLESKKLKIDEECKYIPTVKKLFSTDIERNVLFIKMLFILTSHNMPRIWCVRNIGKESIVELASSLGYIRGSSKVIEECFRDSRSTKYNKIFNEIDDLKRRLNTVEKGDDKNIDKLLIEIDKLKDILNKKRREHGAK